ASARCTSRVPCIHSKRARRRIARRVHHVCAGIRAGAGDRSMSTYRVTATRRIGAPAKIAYDIIADYRHGHTLIVPPKVFQNLQVKSGGFGDGTKICFDVRAFGSTKTLNADITEPTPGRVLVETDLEAGVITTFTVVPTSDGRGCDVTISTDF